MRWTAELPVSETEVGLLLKEKMIPLMLWLSEVGFAWLFVSVTVTVPLPVVIEAVALTGWPPAVEPVGVTNWMKSARAAGAAASIAPTAIASRTVRRELGTS